MTTLRSLLTAILLTTLTACATPGEPGTPLPPQNKAVGDKWAPEARQFIDAMLAFVNSKSAPSIAEIETMFGVKAAAYGTKESNKVSYIEDSYELQGWPLARPSWPAYLTKLLPKNGKQGYLVDFNIDTQRYCIDPYDFAIYTGRKFAVRLNYTPHNPSSLPDEYYRHAYQWGMFDRSPDGQYDSGHVNFTLSDDRRCIGTFEFSASFHPSKMPAINGVPN